MMLKILSTEFQTYFDWAYELGSKRLTIRQAIDFKIDLIPKHCSPSVNFLSSSLETGSSMLVKIFITSWNKVT